jgi:hypothetical protein
MSERCCISYVSGSPGNRSLFPWAGLSVEWHGPVNSVSRAQVLQGLKCCCSVAGGYMSVPLLVWSGWQF